MGRAGLELGLDWFWVRFWFCVFVCLCVCVWIGFIAAEDLSDGFGGRQYTFWLSS